MIWKVFRRETARIATAWPRHGHGVALCLQRVIPGPGAEISSLSLALSRPLDRASPRSLCAESSQPSQLSKTIRRAGPAAAMMGWASSPGPRAGAWPGALPGAGPGACSAPARPAAIAVQDHTRQTRREAGPALAVVGPSQKFIRQFPEFSASELSLTPIQIYAHSRYEQTIRVKNYLIRYGSGGQSKLKHKNNTTIL